ncbi:dipeptide epimerase [Olivibacter sp. CPCC 100613]|uniref:dipeptide epimerase n=1 Tax=Olivibacter sp. CPCC 100613 TaxID=3079931 RepID=UPI002FFB1197
MEHPFRIADNVRTGTPIMLIKISYRDMEGFGEASMPPRYGEDLNTAKVFLDQLDLSQFHSVSPIDPILSYIDHIQPGNPAIKAALDIALHDLWGKITKRSVHELYGLSNEILQTAKTISIEAPEIMAARVTEAKDFRYLKIKLGTAEDRAIIQAIRKVTDQPLYIDANQGWKNKEEAARLIDWLSTQACLFIEQPMPKNDFDAMEWLKNRSSLPIIGDEGIQRIKDIDNAGLFYHGVNIKLMKSTGIREAFTMLTTAKKKGLHTMIGCMSETSCAIAAGAQLGSLAEFIDLDGNLGVTNDPFIAFPCVQGEIRVDNSPGLGLKKPTWDTVEPYIENS